MDVVSAGTGIAPWLVLGVVLGIVLAALAGLAGTLLLRPRRRPEPPEPAVRHDDLPGFRDTPPGFAGARRLPSAGWVSLAPAPTAPAAPEAAGDRPVRLLAGLAAGVLLLIGAAALVAGLSPDRASADRTPAPADDDVVEASASFAGLVLERRAVGVTATTPTLQLTSTGDDARAEVTLPAWNCLADDAPADPDEAGCAQTVTEYAELTASGLTVDRTDDELRISGRFPTVTRPNGGPAEETGRVYALSFTLRPDEDGGADGEARLGDDSAPVVGEAHVTGLPGTD